MPISSYRLYPINGLILIPDIFIIVILVRIPFIKDVFRTAFIRFASQRASINRSFPILLVMTIIINTFSTETDFVSPELFFQSNLIHSISRYRLNFRRPSIKFIFILFIISSAFISKHPLVYSSIHWFFALGKDGTIQQSFTIVELYSIRRLVHAPNVIEFKRSLVNHVVPNNLSCMGKCKVRIDGSFHKFTTINRCRSPLVCSGKEFFQMIFILIIDAFDSEEMRTATIIILDGVTLRQVCCFSVFCKRHADTKPASTIESAIATFSTFLIVFIFFAFTFVQNAQDIASISIDSDHL